jgi:hypothetical protein
MVALDAGLGSPLEPARVAQTYALSRWLAGRPHVQRVDSFVDLHPSLDLATYQQMAAVPPAQRPPELVEALRQTLGDHAAMLVATTTLRPTSEEARALVREIRQSHPPYDGEVMVTGQTAFDLDFIGLVLRHAPFAIRPRGARHVRRAVPAARLGGPSAQGDRDEPAVDHRVLRRARVDLSGWPPGLLARLHARPHPDGDAADHVLLVFGLSMDYEVLLLSRVREEYEKSGDNAGAVIVGLERTGRLITGAAAIMAAVFFGFGLARSVVIQAVGIGIGVAVVVDATIVRALLVPATMRCWGDGTGGGRRGSRCGPGAAPAGSYRAKAECAGALPASAGNSTGRVGYSARGTGQPAAITSPDAHSGGRAMAIKVGDRIPDGTLTEMVDTEREGCTIGPNAFAIGEITKGKKIAIFGLPGAFTPTCSAKHVPSYVQGFDKLRAKGVDEIWCISVNDAS